MNIYHRTLSCLDAHLHTFEVHHKLIRQMFSSLLPKPKHTTIETVRITLPKNTESTAILPVLDLASTSTTVLIIPRDGPHNAIDKLHYNSDGTIDFSKTLQLTPGSSAQSTYEDTIPLKVRFPRLKHHFPSYTLENCPDDSLRRCVEETREVFDRLLARASGSLETASDATVQGYTSTILLDQEVKTILITNLKEDPMLPPKHKLLNNREGKPAPPPPVLKAQPTEKITKEIKDKWHIPSSVSNWKNNQGFTIALDKRVNAASGGAASKGTEFNFENFSKLSLALETADAQARKELEAKHELRKNTATLERAKNDKSLKLLLDQARQRKRSAEEDDYSRKRRHQ